MCSKRPARLTQRKLKGPHFLALDDNVADNDGLPVRPPLYIPSHYHLPVDPDWKPKQPPPVAASVAFAPAFLLDFDAGRFLRIHPTLDRLPSAGGYRALRGITTRNSSDSIP